MDLITHLPGIPVPLPQVIPTLMHMWDAGKQTTQNTQRPDYRASQMNVILHFGPNVQPADALTQFQVALNFACIYPCRLLVLCPQMNEGPSAYSAKIFAQCYIGSGPKNISTCEALLLAYPLTHGNYLDSQISVLLDNDLPTYHWLHQVPADCITRDYLPFLKTCRRVIYDATIECADYAEIPWPSNLQVRNLTDAHMLNARQSIGQFLSIHSPSTITSGLKQIVVSHPEGAQRQAQSLLSWIQLCMSYCNSSQPISYQTLLQPANSALGLTFDYTESQRFKWTYNPKTGSGSIDAQLGGQQPLHLPLQIPGVTPEYALAQSIFF